MEIKRWKEDREISTVVELITTLGFPIACVIALATFIFYVYRKQTEENAANMEKVQERCKEREDKLYNELALNREITGKAVETIALYAERLNSIEDNVEDIRNDVLIIKEKLN